MESLIINIITGIAGSLALLLITNIYFTLRRMSDKMDNLKEAFLHHVIDDTKAHSKLATYQHVDSRIDEKIESIKKDIHLNERRIDSIMHD